MINFKIFELLKKYFISIKATLQSYMAIKSSGASLDVSKITSPVVASITSLFRYFLVKIK